MDNEEQFEFAEESKIDMLNSNVHKEYSRANRSNIPEQDDQVAKSLPIDGGVPSFNKRNLSSMAQNDKAVLSHIETHHCWPNNFGERQDNSRAKTLAQMSQQPKKNSVNPLKYFFSLHEELEIDPVIAADLARLTWLILYQPHLAISASSVTCIALAKKSNNNANNQRSWIRALFLSSMQMKSSSAKN